MAQNGISGIKAELDTLSPVNHVGRIDEVGAEVLRVTGLARHARLGDIVKITRGNGHILHGEIVKLDHGAVTVLPDDDAEGVSLGDRVVLKGPLAIAPDDSWIGRIVDPHGVPLDTRPLMRGPVQRRLRNAPPPAAQRHRLGARLETGMAIFNTFLPIVEGQRIGLFAGSGVGKSSLMGHLARNMDCDVAVVALVGERGRELREFVEAVLGPEGLARTVIITATSDRSALVRRRCAWSAMAVAEHFRDQGRRVLFMADSVTRFAEAHREVAVAAGEIPALRGYPPSTAHQIMQLCERAGPGAGDAGMITAIFSVLVAGSDMEEPVADILRGVLDGHVVMDREIAERGRYPAIDLLRSVSRSLPDAATEEENATLIEARRLMSAYAKSQLMVQAGLYTAGSDPQLDQAIRAWPELDAFLAEKELQGSEHSFNRLRLILRRAAAVQAGVKPAPKRPLRPQQGGPLPKPARPQGGSPVIPG